MINNQPKIRRSKLKPWKTKPVQVTMDPQFALSQGSSTALTPGIPSTSRRPRNVVKEKLASLKNLLRFNRSQNIASSSIGVSASVPVEMPYAVHEPPSLQLIQAAPVDEPQEPTGKIDQPVTCDKIDTAQNELGVMMLVPPATQHSDEVVGENNITISQIDTISSTYLQPFKSFNTVVSTISNVHPYAQMALGVLTNAAQLIITQVNLEKSVTSLLEKIRTVYKFLLEEDTLENLDTMKDTLGCIAHVISNCAQFIKNYSEIKSLWKRLGKNVASKTQTTVGDYNRALDDLMQQYRDHAVRDTHLSIHRVHDDLNSDGMSYAGDAGLNPTKRCLDGTRTEILKEIVDWIHDPDINAPRIFWLHGQAGKGKSAIAHTIGLWFMNVGGLGSCFCFARDRQAERREEKMLSTIACDLAAHDFTFRRALTSAFASNPSLMETPDILRQWEKLFLAPLYQVSKEAGRSVVVVVDALDESGLESSRSHILTILASPETAKLPANIRIFITSRPFPDIQVKLSNARHVKSRSLDDVPVAFTERDIRLFVSTELQELHDIGETEFNQIAQKADGLFEWARLACMFIRSNATGETVKDAFNNIIARTSGQGKTLLDSMYREILETVVSRRSTALARFRSVMGQVLYTLEPLPIDALNAMRKCFSRRKDHYNVAIVLHFLGALLSGVTDNTNPVRPLHASFYDFLTNKSRSGDYFVGESDIQADLAVTSLHILRGGLCFNICGLESSYLLNSEVPDLAERIKVKIPSHLSYSCQFWAEHLQAIKFDHVVAGHVKDIVGNERILFWFEALSLLGVLHNVMFALLRVERWLQGQEEYEDVAALVRDGVKFIHNFAIASSASTPHLYISALPFTPENSVLYRALKTKFACMAQVAEGYYKEWPVAQDVFEGHISLVGSVAFSPDGTRIVSGSLDMTVRVWDADRGIQIGSPLQGHTGSVSSVAFSPDGTRIVSGSHDNTVRIWDVNKRAQVGSPLQGHTDLVASVAFSPAGTRIVSSSHDRTVRVWDADKGVQIGSPLQGHTNAVSSVAFSPDGTKIVSGSFDKTVRVWDADRGMQTGSPLQGHTGYVASVAFSPDGTRIVSGSSDNTVRIWDADKGVQICSPLQGSGTSVAFSPDGTRIVSGSRDNTVRVWDADRGVQVGCPLQGHTHWVASVAFSPDGTRIVSGSDDNTVRVWNVDRGMQISSPLKDHTDCVTSVAFSPDGTRIVSGSFDKTMRIWDADRGVQIGSPLQGHTSSVTSVAFSPDGTKIVSGSFDKTVRIWDADRGVWTGSPLQGHAHYVTSVAFSPDGTRIVSGSFDKTVRVWDADRGMQIDSPLLVTSVAFSPNGTRIVSGTSDKTVRVWDAVSGVQVGSPLQGHFDAVTSVAFSPDGRRIVSGSHDKTVRVWDANRGVQISNPLQGHTHWITSVAFSPDGTRTVSGSRDNTVRIWDADKGVQIGCPLQGHTHYVASVAFSPDGTRVVSGSDDKTVRVWDANRGVQIGSQLQGHTNWVTSAAFSPNGTRTISDPDDKTATVSPVERAVNINSTTEGNAFCRSNEEYISAINEGHSLHPVTLLHSDAQHHATHFPIQFSTVPSHALYDRDQELCCHNEQDFHQCVKLHIDGWIRGPHGQLLLWVPHDLRDPFYSMWTRLVIPKGSVELDLSNMAHGKKWQECFESCVY